MASELLSLTNLQRVREVLWGARKKWKGIGLGLGLHPDDLANIDIEGADNGDRLTNMLIVWLQRPSLSPSWRKLAAVLETRSVGRNDIARQIKNVVPEVENKGQVEKDRQTELLGKLALTLQAVAGLLALLVIAILVLQYMYTLPKAMKVFSDDWFKSPAVTIATGDTISSLGIPDNSNPCSTIGSNNLPDLPGPFVGKEEDIDNITTSFLARGSWTKVISIYGIPAVGKSTLAIHVGYRMACQGIAIRYINLDDAYLKSLYSEETFDIRSSSSVGEERGSAVAKLDNSLLYYSEENKMYTRTSPRGLLDWAISLENQTLLILDNCDRLLNKDDNVNDFHKLLLALSQASRFLQVLTSSRHRMSLIDGFREHHLKNLSDQAAVGLLLSQLESSISYEQAKNICELVGNLPLALRIIIGLHLNRKVPLDVVIAKLREDPLSEEVHRVLSLSYNYLDSTIHDCSYYMTIFPGSFSEDAVIAILRNFTNISVCLERLEELSLIEHYWYAGESRYHFHKLVKEFFKRPTENFSFPPSRDEVSCSFGLYFSRSLSTFVENHQLMEWIDDVEGIGRLEYDSHNHRVLRLLLMANASNPMMISSQNCMKGVAKLVHNAVTLDINNLLLLLFSQEELGEFLMLLFVHVDSEVLHAPNFSHVSCHNFNFIQPGRRLYEPSKHCEQSAGSEISFSKCCRLCTQAFGDVSCQHCLCLHRQPSDLFFPGVCQKRNATITRTFYNVLFSNSCLPISFLPCPIEWSVGIYTSIAATTITLLILYLMLLIIALLVLWRVTNECIAEPCCFRLVDTVYLCVFFGSCFWSLKILNDSLLSYEILTWFVVCFFLISFIGLFCRMVAHTVLACAHFRCCSTLALAYPFAMISLFILSHQETYKCDTVVFYFS